MAGGLHAGFDRFLLVNSTKTSGGSTSLVKNQFGVIDYNPKNNTVDGLKILDSAGINAIDKFGKLAFRVGSSNKTVARSQSDKAQSSIPFRFEDVVEVGVTVPNMDGQRVDEVILGYNGDVNTSLELKKGHRYVINLKLSGGIVEWLGYSEGCVTIPHLINVEGCLPAGCDPCVECDECETVDCSPYILEAIEAMRSHKLRANYPVSEVVDILPIRSFNYQDSLTKIPYTFYCLDVCDAGTSQALADVQASYPSLKVIKTGRKEGISSYQVMRPTAAGAPADYSTTVPSFKKDCDACPTGTTEVAAGFMYMVMLVDDGADDSATAETLVNAVAGTAEKLAGAGATGTYTVKLSAELSDTDLQTFLTANPTASVTFTTEVEAVCETAGTTDFTWTDCGTCNAVEETYEIQLPDTECGDSRLAELQAAYGDLVVTEVAASEVMCQRKYATTVTSNLVCDECDPAFLDYYKTDAPKSFENRDWVNTTTYDELPAGTPEYCGIRFVGKVIENCPEECLIDTQGVVRESVRIEVSGGFTTSIGENYSNESTPFHTEQVRLATVDTQRGGSFLQVLRESRYYFTNEERSPDYQTRTFKQSEYDVDICGAYITYKVAVKDVRQSQGFGDKSGQYIINYHFVVPYGKQAEVEGLINVIAAKAGLKPVQATA